MTDILRWGQPLLIWTLGAIVFLFVAAWLIISALKKAGETKLVGIIKWIRNIGLVLTLIVFVWQLLVGLSVNNVNRSTIDRSGVNFDRYSETATP